MASNSDHVVVTSAVSIADLQNHEAAPEIRRQLGEQVFTTAIMKAVAEGKLKPPEKPDWVDTDAD